jgi:SNF family Na+-dependent transporter
MNNNTENEVVHNTVELTEVKQATGLDKSKLKASKAWKSHLSGEDCKNGRDRWANPFFFLLSTFGASLGLGNIWKFPSLCYLYGGTQFVITYVIIMFIVGIPMLILEQTLGQKMQRGSAGALRGIFPRLAGVGWMASYAGFLIGILYTYFLGLTLYYLVISKEMPWKKYTIPFVNTKA